jgi:hypothetical protein
MIKQLTEPLTFEAVDLLADAIHVEAPDILCVALDGELVEPLLETGARHVWYLEDGGGADICWSAPERVTAVPELEDLLALPVDWIVGAVLGDDYKLRAAELVQGTMAPTLYLALPAPPNGWARDLRWHRVAESMYIEGAGAYCLTR